jgi:hypothetical protein
MYKIILTTECGSKQNLSCVISKAQYNAISNALYLGGFKRFDIELYSDNEPKQKSEINFALSFLSINVFKCSVIDLKKIFKN